MVHRGQQRQRPRNSNYLAGITIDPQNDYAWVVAKKDNTERGELFNNTPAGHDNTVRAMMLPIDLSLNAEYTESRFPIMRMDFDNSDSPSAITFNEHGDYAFVTIQGNNQFVVIDMIAYRRNRAAPPLLTRRGTGNAPQGIVFDGQGSQIIVHEFMQRGLGIYEADDFLGKGSSPSTKSAYHAVG